MKTSEAEALALVICPVWFRYQVRRSPTDPDESLLGRRDWSEVERLMDALPYLDEMQAAFLSFVAGIISGRDLSDFLESVYGDAAPAKQSSHVATHQTDGEASRGFRPAQPGHPPYVPDDGRAVMPAGRTAALRTRSGGPAPTPPSRRRCWPSWPTPTMRPIAAGCG